MDALFPLPDVWTPEDTQAYLTANPLPSDFTWPHRDELDGGVRPVHPTYQVKNYGKWLRETPYFPGLFEQIHDVLARADRVPSIEALAMDLKEQLKLRGKQDKLMGFD